MPACAALADRIVTDAFVAPGRSRPSLRQVKVAAFGAAAFITTVAPVGTDCEIGWSVNDGGGGIPSTTLMRIIFAYAAQASGKNGATGKPEIGTLLATRSARSFRP